MRRALATDFGIWLTADQSTMAAVSDVMVTSPSQWSELANYLLLYDQIVIPTGNLQVLPVLRIMLGEDLFEEMIQTKGIVLARVDQWFGYSGNGGGLGFFQIHRNPERGPTNLGLGFFLPLDQAIDVALAMTNPPSDADRRRRLTSLLIDHVVQLPTQQIAEHVQDETYKDISGSRYLQDMLSLRNRGRSLNHLKGIRPNEVKLLLPHSTASLRESPEIRSVLRVAFENFLLSIGTHIQATDITSDDGTLSILRAKGQRFGLPLQGSNAFAQIQLISSVPNIGAAFASKQISPHDLLKLRHSNHCQALREWFSDGARSESEQEIVQRYVESIGRVNWIETLPVKVLRFGVANGIGLVEPISGIVAKAIDSFLLSKWFPGTSPRLFLKEAKIILARQPPVAAPKMRGRDRNRPCPCGSGKKYKNCCG